MSLFRFLTAIALSTPAANENPAVLGRFADCFQTREYRYSGGEGPEEIVVPYRLFVPRNVRHARRRPLLVWLHGKAEGGLDNRLNLTHLPTLLKDSGPIEQCPFFILVPQCPSPEIVWTTNLGSRKLPGLEPQDMLTATDQILQETMRQQSVDPDRVYLAGVCSGGSACWEMAMRHPELFAALVPTTPGGGRGKHSPDAPTRRARLLERGLPSPWSDGLDARSTPRGPHLLDAAGPPRMEVAARPGRPKSFPDGRRRLLAKRAKTPTAPLRRRRFRGNGAR